MRCGTVDLKFVMGTEDHNGDGCRYINSAGLLSTLLDNVSGSSKYGRWAVVLEKVPSEGS